MARIICCCCGREVIPKSRISNKHVAPGIGARPSTLWDRPYCGDCAGDMDENGLFPENPGYNKYPKYYSHKDEE